MDLTEGTFEEKNARAKKMMLWFGIISLLMSFAGWTSAYIVSSSRPDWISDYNIPSVFLYSTITIMVSSITFHLAKRGVQKGERKISMLLLMATFVLGCIFIRLQFLGFGEIIANGYNLTGPTSNIVYSFIYLIAAVHILHVIAGLIVLTTVIYNHYKEKYKPGQTLGIELGALFWHFLDFLWVYLILFFYFFR